METDSFVEETEKFIESATWLDDADRPAVHALRKLAFKLDLSLTAPIMQQYRFFYGQLSSGRPAADSGAVDPVDKFFDQRDDSNS